jgi:hypothetical protein
MSADQALEIGFGPNLVWLKRMQWDFQNIVVPFHFVPLQKIFSSQSKILRLTEWTGIEQKLTIYLI